MIFYPHCNPTKGHYPPGIILIYYIFQAYHHYTKKQSRRMSIEEYLPKDSGYHTKFPLVRYRGCVLPEDMVMSGTMEVI